MARRWEPPKLYNKLGYSRGVPWPLVDKMLKKTKPKKTKGKTDGK